MRLCWKLGGGGWDGALQANQRPRLRHLRRGQGRLERGLESVLCPSHAESNHKANASVANRPGRSPGEAKFLGLSELSNPSSDSGIEQRDQKLCHGSHSFDDEAAARAKELPFTPIVSVRVRSANLLVFPAFPFGS